MKKDITVLLVDDHTLVREGFSSILSHTEGIRICGSCASGEEAIGLTRTLHPDVVLMDIVMSGMTGIEATRWIKEQDSKIKVILLSMEVRKDFVSAGIKAGIDGFLPKDSSKDMLVEAIQTIYQGERYFTEAITKLIFEDFYLQEKSGKKRSRQLSEGLTARENEVLEFIALGISNKDTADKLFISVKTVETHKMHILDKLGLKNKSELTIYAIKHNIISIE